MCSSDIIQEIKTPHVLLEVKVKANTGRLYCVHRVGGEKVLLLSAAAWGSMTAFTPILAHFCSQPILSMTLARFLMGLLQGEIERVQDESSSLEITLGGKKSPSFGHFCNSLFRISA